MIDFRAPVLSDCGKVRRIAGQSELIEQNSFEYYAAYVRDFSDTSLIAVSGVQPVGFVLGHRSPAAPEEYVVAQWALLPEFDRAGARATLLLAAVRPQVRSGARQLEVVAAERDEMTLAALERVAAHQGAVLRSEAPMGEGIPPDAPCALYRIGPLSPAYA